MKDSEQKKSSNFESKDEAFEYLVQQGQNQALKDFWKEELDKMPDAKIKKLNGGGGKKILFRIAVIAASFVFILSAYIFFFNTKNDLPQMANAMIHETNFMLESDALTRGLDKSDNSQEIIALQKEIITALENQDYSQSTQLLQKKEGMGLLSNSDRFYFALSMARRESGDLQKALQLTNEVIKEKKKYYHEALWLQALVYLRLEKSDQAKSTLNTLLEQSRYQSKNAGQLLKEIEK